jgi:hypothetical protein
MIDDENARVAREDGGTAAEKLAQIEDREQVAAPGTRVRAGGTLDTSRVSSRATR